MFEGVIIMSYDELKRNTISEFKYLHKEVNDLLEIKEEEYNEKVDYCYYKNPFGNVKSKVEPELIVFTKSKHIVEAKPVYSDDNVPYKIDISFIDRINYITSRYDRDIEAGLEIIFKNSSIIKLDSTDVNYDWQRDASDYIRDIARYLLQEE